MSTQFLAILDGSGSYMEFTRNFWAFFKFMPESITKLFQKSSVFEQYQGAPGRIFSVLSYLISNVQKHAES